MWARHPKIIEATKTVFVKQWFHQWVLIANNLSWSLDKTLTSTYLILMEGQEWTKQDLGLISVFVFCSFRVVGAFGPNLTCFLDIQKRVCNLWSSLWIVPWLSAMQSFQQIMSLHQLDEKKKLLHLWTQKHFGLFHTTALPNRTQLCDLKEQNGLHRCPGNVHMWLCFHQRHCAWWRTENCVTNLKKGDQQINGHFEKQTIAGMARRAFICNHWWAQIVRMTNGVNQWRFMPNWTNRVNVWPVTPNQIGAMVHAITGGISAKTLGVELFVRTTADLALLHTLFCAIWWNVWWGR